MIIFPAIDLKDKNCVRLKMGDYNTVHKVAKDPVMTALEFKKNGAQWLHMVDLDGAKDATTANSQVVLDVLKNSGLKIEIGGGIRDMKTVEFYLENGISRVILGSAAVKNPQFIKEAVKKYPDNIAVGIDAKDGMVATDGWIEKTDIHYIELAKRMEQIGVKYIIYTDISKDGMLCGSNIQQLYDLSKAVSCNITASGGVSCLDDIKDIASLNLYAAICGKAIYSGNLDLREAINYTNKPNNEYSDIRKFFKKDSLIPAIVQDYNNEEVLMLAYVNKESFEKMLLTGYTWFYSRSRQELWNKGATSGHYQKVISISGDCDSDTLLIKVLQTGNACHTGKRSCFFERVL